MIQGKGWKYGRRSILFTIAVLLIFAIGYILGKSGRTVPMAGAADKLKVNITNRIANAALLEDRELVMMENPDLIPLIMEGGKFGNDVISIAAAKNMFSRDEKAIANIKDKTKTIQIAPRIWMIRMPIVNSIVVETDEGLVIIDTGMSPGGPALLKEIRKISKKRIHTLIYTHAHVDHCYGTWALMEAGETPQIIAHDNVIPRFHRYLKLRGSIAKYMSQPVQQLPANEDDIVWPTRTFSDSLELTIGGERFILKHHPGETDDQLYVWLPDQKVLAAADYYQGFMPNAGNRKRVQRFVEAWSDALKEMANLEPEIMLPGHGALVIGVQTIRENLDVLAETFDYITDHTLRGLNAGLRKDEVFQSLILPEHLASHPTLKNLYVQPQDISKMIIKQYTGWWDDIPSHWSPATIERQAAAIVALAGGIDAVVAHTRSLMNEDIRLACHFADWAFYADPHNRAVKQLVLDVYRMRIRDPLSTTQEMLVYLDQMAKVRGMMRD